MMDELMLLNRFNDQKKELEQAESRIAELEAENQELRNTVNKCKDIFRSLAEALYGKEAPDEKI